MMSKLFALISLFCCLWISTHAYIKVGLIHKKGYDGQASIVEHVFRIHQSDDSNGNSDIEYLKEVADEEDTRSYHRAFCRLLAAGIDAFISSADSPYYSLLSDYANEYHIPFITPELPQSISLSSNNYSFGIRPITTRAVLRLFQLYRWSDVVYLYDHDDGPENLNFMFAVGSRVLNLTLDGMLKVTSAAEANEYLQNLDKSLKNKSFHVVLDTDSDMAFEIIRRHVNDIHVRKKNFHFALSKPLLEDYWNSKMGTFGAVNVTAFTIRKQFLNEDTFMQQIKSELGDYLNLNYYYYYDAAIMLKEAARRFIISESRARFKGQTYRYQVEPSQNCLEYASAPSSKGIKLSNIVKEIRVPGITGKIQFENGQRANFDLNVTEVSFKGMQRIGFWSNGNFYSDSSSRRTLPTAMPLIQTRKRLQIVSVIYPPYMMLKTAENETSLQGNDRFEGYCKDIIDLMARNLSFEYDIHLTASYGRYDESQGRWSGMIGELIEGKADLAVADLTITGERQRVIDFTDPFALVGLSLVMKNPRTVSKLSSVLFFLSAFTVDVWICVLVAVLLFCVLFHFITKFTGAPDSIESASGIWGRKHTVVANLWFAIGSSMLQGTGVYPRSISSRILSGFCWFFTLILSSLFIASITAQILISRQMDDNSPQLSRIKALSMESIIKESVYRGWPRIGLISPSHAEYFIRKSNLPLFVDFVKYLENNPDVVVSTDEEGIERVRKSNGDYMVLLESSISDYATKRKPCDIIATHNAFSYASYGFATSLGSHLTLQINEALHAIQEAGMLGELHRKWWIDSNECKNVIVEDKTERTTHVYSGLLCASVVGFIILLAVFAVQYIRRNQNKETRRQQLSFEDMNLGQTLPTPPPELLAEPAPVLNLPEYDKRTLL